MDQHLTTNLSRYMRLSASASAETIRRNPLTSPYSEFYFKLARQYGLAHARTWLLGSLIHDMHNAST